MRLRDAGILAALSLTALPGCGASDKPKTLEEATQGRTNVTAELLGDRHSSSRQTSEQDLYNAVKDGLSTLRGIVNPEILIHLDSEYKPSASSKDIRTEASAKLAALQKALINTRLGSESSIHDTELRELFIKVSAIRGMLDDNALTSPFARLSGHGLDGNNSIVYEAIGTSIWLMGKLAN